MDATEATYRCPLRMERAPGGAFRLFPVEGAECRSDAADGIDTMTVEPIKFANEDQEDEVTWQLASDKVFEDLATECRR